MLSRDALEKIQTGDSTWETMVPEPAMRLIRDRELFRAQAAGKSGGPPTAARSRSGKSRGKRDTS